MITLRSFCGAIRKALLARHRAEMAQAVHAAEKASRREEVDAGWRAELKRREEQQADADGQIAAQRKALQEQQEQERLDFLAAQIIRQTMKSVSR